LKLDSCAPGLGKADGDGLFDGTRAMDALANMVDFFPDKLSRLCRGRFALLRVSPRTFDRILTWHFHPLRSFSRNFQRIPIRLIQYFRFDKQVAAKNPARNLFNGRFLFYTIGKRHF
jgi:hypothetical protein